MIFSPSDLTVIIWFGFLALFTLVMTKLMEREENKWLELERKAKK